MPTGIGSLDTTIGQFNGIGRNLSRAFDMASMSDEEYAEKQREVFASKNPVGVEAYSGNKYSMVRFMQNFIDASFNSVGIPSGWVDDPAFDCALFQIDWSDTSGLFAEESNINSALWYLKHSGESERYIALKQVHEVMHQLFDVARPDVKAYCLQEINGLSDLNENRRKRGVDNNIELVCTEALDWRIRFINTKLDFICYDDIRQIEVLPKNLLRFSCYIHVTDVRDLQDLSVPVIDKFDQSGKASTAPIVGTIETGIAEGMREPLDKSPEALLTVMQGNNSYQHMQALTVIATSCYFNPKVLPDTISNVGQTEVRGTLSLNIRAWYVYDVCSIMLNALQTVTQLAAEELASVASDGKKTSKFKQFMKKLGKAAMNYAKNLAISYADAGISYAKSMVMDIGYNLLEKAGVVDFANMVLSYTKPSVILAKYGGQANEALQGLLGLDNGKAIESMYFDDHRTVSDSASIDSKFGYFTDKRKASGPATDNETSYFDNNI